MMENLVSKICALMKEIGAIPKTGYNTFHRYHYRTHEDVMKHLQPLLAKHGLMIFPKNKELLVDDTVQVKSGIQRRLLIKCTYVIADGKDYVEFVGIGEGCDSMDKASYKAQTGATKYALNDLLMLASESDPEAENGNNSEPKKTAESIPSQGQAEQDETKLKISDLMDSMGFTAAKQQIRFKKAEAIGAEKVLEELNAEYFKWKQENEKNG